MTIIMLTGPLKFYPNVFTLRGIGTLSGEETLSKFFESSEKLPAVKGKNLLPKFFPFIVSTFSEGVLCAGKQKVRHKSYLSCKKGWKIYHSSVYGPHISQKSTY